MAAVPEPLGHGVREHLWETGSRPGSVAEIAHGCQVRAIPLCHNTIFACTLCKFASVYSIVNCLLLEGGIYSNKYGTSYNVNK